MSNATLIAPSTPGVKKVTKPILQVVKNLQEANRIIREQKAVKTINDPILAEFMGDADTGIYAYIKVASRVRVNHGKANVDLETLKLAFPEAYAAVVTPFVPYSYFRV